LKINVEQSNEFNEVEIVIKCRSIDENLEKMISTIRLYNSSICGKRDDKTYFLKLEDVFYFDSVDEKVFIYTADNIYETSLKLYELEERFTDSSIIRVSKSNILNIMKIESVSPIPNGRIEAVLQNNERLIISRQYVSNFKNKLGF
jgi:DNA-binding LytR/AlgR family response regulator